MSTQETSSRPELDALIAEQARDMRLGHFQRPEFPGMISLDQGPIMEALADDGTMMWGRDKLEAYRVSCPLHGVRLMYRKADGRLCCRPCRQIEQRDYYARNPEKMKEKGRQRYARLKADPERHERELARQKAWWAANKDKRNAQRRAKRAESSRKRDTL